MEENIDKTTTNSENVVLLDKDSEIREFLGDDSASILENPKVSWAKFVLTDDLPNGNRRRIPESEFDNIIKSGTFMPVKMAEGEIKPGHNDSKPIGVITNLKKVVEDGVNKIVALAALWSFERPEDVRLLKELHDADKPIDVSWELSFGDVQASEGGVVDYLDIVLKAATIVTRPAYKGRTRFLAFAAKSKNWSDLYIKNLPDSSFLVIEAGGELDSEGKTSPRELRHFPIKDEAGLINRNRLDLTMEEIAQSNLSQNTLKVARKAVKAIVDRVDAGASLEEISFTPYLSENTKMEDVKLENLEELNQQLQEAKTKLEAALAQLKEKEEAVATATASLESLTEEKGNLESELTSLREFKTQVESETAKAEKLLAIKAKFAEAKLDKDEEYFTEHEATLLNLSDSDLEFMIQELSAFSKESAEASLKNVNIPNLTNSNITAPSVSEIVTALRNRKAN